MKPLFFLSLLLFFSCQNAPESTEQTVEMLPKTEIKPATTSLLGEPLFAPDPSEKALEKLAEKRNAYEVNPDFLMNLIWYGRFLAYAGKYQEAIDLYTQGIEKFPEEARLYRHRGHRYITLRKLDNAIADFEKAAQLIENQPNAIEPDGMPNARNEPVSTTHGNIYYHLGLAYYLKHDWGNALSAYEKCRATGSKPDNLVSSTHWLYMIARRMGKPELAKSFLTPITADLDVIENQDYHRACLFYQGELTAEEFAPQGEDNPGKSAAQYALGNWYLYNGKTEQAEQIFKEMTDQKGWAAFGYIAAEADLAMMEK
ncbi:MAG: tetratricopeptide repeat protein [Saprospiraceae bacterium]